MNNFEFTRKLLDRLRMFDTPTICNAIEVAQGRRGHEQFTKRTMHWTGQPKDVIVGYARTAKIAGNRAPTEPGQALRERRLAYFRSMASGPRPSVAIVEDADGDTAFGAWWGELHAAVHSRVFNLSGAITNGIVRDLNDLPDGFPILAGGIGPSHGFVHVREIGQPVEVFGMRVAQGDLVHADRHGAVVVPQEVLPSLDEALNTLIGSESIVLKPVQTGSVDFAEFERLWTAFEDART